MYIVVYGFNIILYMEFCVTEAIVQEAEKMIQFMDETAMSGYEKLLETSRDYQNDVGDIGMEANSNLDIANGLDVEVNRFKLN